MSGTLAPIFSFEASRKWIIRDGLTGISSRRLGRVDRERMEEVAGVSNTFSLRALEATSENGSVRQVEQATIREARAGEEGALVPLYEWLFEPPGSRPEAWDPERASAALREAIDSADSVVLLAEDAEGALVGICTAYLDLNSVRFGPRVWVEDLAVDPARRSQGIGAALLAQAREWGRARGATHLELDSSLARADAHRFYEREGAVGKSYSYAWPL